MKRGLLLATCLFLITALVSCASAPSLQTIAPETTAAQTAATRASTAATTAATTTTFAITTTTELPEDDPDLQTTPDADIAILYTSDIRGAVDSGMGYAGLATYRDELAAEGCEVLLVDTGDAFEGAPAAMLDSGLRIAQLMNTLGYSACVPAYGSDAFTALSETADFAFVAADIEGCRDYAIVDCSGVSIAFLGVSSSLSGRELYAVVQSAADEAREDGADYCIALTRLSDEDVRALIAATSGIDAFLNGGTQESIECARVLNAAGEHIPLSCAGAEFSDVGLLLINRRGGITTGLVDEEYTPDETVAAMITEISDELAAPAAETLGSLTIQDADSGVRLVRSGETTLGDAAADAVRAAGGTDLAVVPGSLLRAGLPAGTVTQGDLLTSVPSDEALLRATVTGQDILDMLEYVCREYPAECDDFLQISGLTFSIRSDVASTVALSEDGSFTIGETRRVQDVMIGETALDAGTEYTLCAPESVYANLPNLSGAETESVGTGLRSALTDYLAGDAYKTAAESYTAVQGRIRAVVAEAETQTDE